MPLCASQSFFFFFSSLLFSSRDKNSSKVAALGVPMAKAQFGKVGDGWKEGEAGLV